MVLKASTRIFGSAGVWGGQQLESLVVKQLVSSSRR